MKIRKKTLVVTAAGIVALLVGAFAARSELERGYVAYRVHRAEIFTPPPATPGESRWTRRWHDARFYWDFAGIHMARAERLKLLNPELKPVIKELDRRQAAGENMQYSMHIYREVRWMLNFTPDAERTRARIEDLRTSLNEPEKQKTANEQVPADGSWGMGIDAWYLRLYYTVEDGVDNQQQAKYPLHVLDRINSPEGLKAQLDSALYDDFTRTGEFKREELDETSSAIMRLLFKNIQSGYAFDPRLPDAMRSYIDAWQNPETGCWGQWLVDRFGRVWKMDDTGITFHVISDTTGKVQHLDRATKRLIELDKLDFPAGPRMNGHPENHLNWDLVKIFHYAWPTLDEPTRARVRKEISGMLEWCLKDSLQSNGEFKTSDIDDTLGDAQMYGALFLRDAGYFDASRRFWTDTSFPDADAVRGRIAARLNATGLSDPNMKAAYTAVTDGR